MKESHIVGHKRVSQLYNFPPAPAGSREAWIMPTISRLRGRFFCVLIALILAVALPPGGERGGYWRRRRAECAGIAAGGCQR